MNEPAERFYVTTSIPYVNADPHLGHALELVQADVLARHRRQRGSEVRFQSGTDDNSLKNVQGAESAGVPVQEFVDRHADTFESLRGSLDLSFDDFLRTSRDPRHRPGVERLWQACAANGDLYRKHYEGLYCVGCERFYTPDELVDGRCEEHEAPLQLVSEENWFFRLSRYQNQLEQLYESGRIRIEPDVRRNEVRSFVKGGLTDFSISRSVERAHGWGIPVPGDAGQVMYVWWDALGNYITSLDFGSESGSDATAFRRWWTDNDRKVHVVGKGILRFHAVYWPAMLLSAGLPLPTDVFVHDYLTANGRKLSKSSGNAVGPLEVLEEYGADALRWWLVARVPKVGDTDFTVQGLVDAANRDLAGGVGNLGQRVVTMVHRYRDGVVSDDVDDPVSTEAASGDADRLRQACAALPCRIDEALQAFDIRRAAAALTALVAEANRYVEATAPWALAKAERSGDTGAGKRLDTTLGTLVATCCVLARELRPFVPTLAERLSRQVGGQAVGEPLPAPDPVFPRLDAPA